MKQTLPFKHLLVKTICGLLCMLSFSAANSQTYQGRDGSKNYSTAGTYILNRYTSLAGSANAGTLSFTVADITQLSGAYSFTNSANTYATDQLRSGDLIMIIQMQGADITTTDDANYGAITAYNGTGNYDIRQVFSVSGNTIYICEKLSHTYIQSGRSRVQIVRIPRLSSLTVGALATVTGSLWSGTSGGVVALEVDGNTVIDGTVTATALGFRGGVDDKTVSSSSGAAVISLYTSTSPSQSGSKGESIAGNPTDYNTLLNGNYGRGAPANGGGGGNGHNTGGGGGSNAGTNGVLTPWNGTGIKSTSTAAWAGAWNLEAANFATDVSKGGGRGGYSYSNSNQDALVLGPGATAWGGDHRQNVGGFGGRPLQYASDRLFMGGGGGAGEGNNSSSGDGGNGGGIIYLLVKGNISGSGTITANGQDGFNTQNSFIDAAGGAGGGGAIVAAANGNITGVSIKANGGRGGDQLYLTGEAEGPGGGGGGGYIATTTTSVTKEVLGGDNGFSYSTMVTEFLPNGATMGAAGTITSTSYFSVKSCSSYGTVLKVNLASFSATLQNDKVALQWATASEENNSHFELERSTDGNTYSTIAIVFSKGNSTSAQDYEYTDPLKNTTATVIYYRLKIIGTDNKITYSEVKSVRITSNKNENSLTVYPNPLTSGALQVTVPLAWTNKKVVIGVYDLNGKKLYTYEKNKAATTELINMQDLAAGVYILRAASGNEVLQQKIIRK